MKRTWDSDRDPLVALGKGDASLFEAFVAEETATFLGFFRRLGAGSAEAEDLVQDVFLKLFRQANHYQPNGRFTAFVFRIARNAWIDSVRRGALRPQRLPGSDDEENRKPTRELASTQVPPPEVAQRTEEAGRVTRALQHLSEGQRLVFELGVVQELPYCEIARALEIPEGTVKSRMFHALRKLKAVLENTTTKDQEGVQPR